MKDMIDKFLQETSMKAIRFKNDKPESMKVKAWRFLKKFEDRTGINPNVKISLEPGGIILKKEKVEATCILENGEEVSFEEFRGPSKDVIKFCQEMRDKANGTLPSWDTDFEIPSEEKIKEWNMSKADEKLCLKTLQEIKESSVIRMSEKEQE